MQLGTSRLLEISPRAALHQEEGPHVWFRIIKDKPANLTFLQGGWKYEKRGTQLAAARG